MGMVFVFMAIIGFVLSMIIGMILKSKHSKLLASGQGGSKSLFYITFVVVFLLVILLGYLKIPNSSGGAPSGQDYEDMMYVFTLFGSTPGLGMIIGSLVVIFATKKTK
jgi:hypothetical protein